MSANRVVPAWILDLSCCPRRVQVSGRFVSYLTASCLLNAPGYLKCHCMPALRYNQISNCETVGQSSAAGQSKTMESARAFVVTRSLMCEVFTCCSDEYQGKGRNI